MNETEKCRKEPQNQSTAQSAGPGLYELTAGRRGEYLLSLILSFGGVLCALVPYFIMIDLIRDLIRGSAEWNGCLEKCLRMGGWWILRYVFHSASMLLSHHATFHVLADIRIRLLDKLAAMPLGTVMDHSSGTYKNLIAERVDSIEPTLAHLVPEMTSNLAGAVSVLIFVFLIDWRLGLSALVVLPLGILFMSMTFRGYEENFKRTVDSTKALNDAAVEYINGIEIIKAFGQSKTSYEKFVAAAREGADCFIDWMQGCLFGQTAGMAVFPATLLGILPVGCFLTMRGSLETEVFLTVLILSFGIMQPLVTVFSYTDDLAQVRTILGEVTGVLREEELGRPHEAKTLPKNSAIELEDVRFSYGEKEVLHGISMHIEAGTVNAIVGPSGSGKSTIARLIASLWNTGSGKILLGGVDLKELPLKECTDRIAYVSQENYLFDLSVMDNIRLGRRGASDEEVIAAARTCGCHEFIMRLEQGYDTMCGASGGHLSGGERQRIAIARAMLKDAPIVILDEATSYTDPENEAVIQKALTGLVRGKTLLVIAHRLSTIADADRIFVMQDGSLLAQGRHEELLRDCGLYRKMWEAHVSVKDQGEVA